jgi:hypothetical protein
MNEETLYSKVVGELRDQGPRQGLWAKAFAEAGGNELSARAAYLRLRVQQLAEEERQKEVAIEAARIAEEQAQRLAAEDLPGGAPHTTAYTWIAVAVIVVFFVFMFYAARG